MGFIKDYRQQFRESEASGLIGLKGYMYYFQDMVTEHLHLLGKGNDTLPEDYGCAWMFVKYKLNIIKQADFTKPLHLETWVSRLDKIRIWQDLEISCDGELYAFGRLENCPVYLKNAKLCRLEEISFPDILENRKTQTAAFCRFPKEYNDMAHVYDYQVQYTDLDKSRHMNNLQYVNLFMNAFTPEFYDKNKITGFELHYISQCYFGEKLAVYQRASHASVTLAAFKQDKTLAAQCVIELA